MWLLKTSCRSQDGWEEGVGQAREEALRPFGCDVIGIFNPDGTGHSGVQMMRGLSAARVWLLFHLTHPLLGRVSLQKEKQVSTLQLVKDSPCRSCGSPEERSQWACCWESAGRGHRPETPAGFLHSSLEAEFLLLWETFPLTSGAVPGQSSYAPSLRPLGTRDHPSPS